MNEHVMSPETYQKTKTRWKMRGKRFVACLDICGFKNLIEKKSKELSEEESHAMIYKLLKNISSAREDIKKEVDLLSRLWAFANTDIYSVSFSDSYFVFSKNDDLSNFDQFINSVNKLFAKFIDSSIPIKGTIAYGFTTINKSRQIYLGQPIVDAYLLEQKVEYYGVACHKSIDEYILENKMHHNKNWFEYDTPFNSGNKNYINLNWFRYMKRDFGKNLKETIISRIKSCEPKDSDKAKLFVDNTLKLFEEAIVKPYLL
jgi:hypothetical protein